MALMIRHNGTTELEVSIDCNLIRERTRAGDVVDWWQQKPALTYTSKRECAICQKPLPPWRKGTCRPCEKNIKFAGRYSTTYGASAKQVFDAVGANGLNQTVPETVQDVIETHHRYCDPHAEFKAMDRLKLHGYVAFDQSTPKLICECGSEKCGSSSHSDWCPKYAQ